MYNDQYVRNKIRRVDEAMLRKVIEAEKQKPCGEVFPQGVSPEAYADCKDAAFPSLAMVCVPMQEWESLYSMENGFTAGTMFKKLNKPFCGATVYSERGVK